MTVPTGISSWEREEILLPSGNPSRRNANSVSLARIRSRIRLRQFRPHESTLVKNIVPICLKHSASCGCRPERIGQSLSTILTTTNPVLFVQTLTFLSHILTALLNPLS